MTLNRMTRKKYLKDWRRTKDENKCTFYSSVNKCYSRIDYIFASNSLITRIIGMEVDLIKNNRLCHLNTEINIKRDYKEAKRLDTDIFQ